MNSKLSSDSEEHLRFIETFARRTRSGSYQFLKQADQAGTKAIGEALTKLQETLQAYRVNNVR